MGRIRTIKPDFHTNEALSSLPAEAHLLASGLLCYADDEGYFDANPKLVQAAVFPLRELQVGIVELMAMLLKINYITVSTVSGKRIGHVVTFKTHQRVNRPSPSRLKPHVQLTEISPTEGKGKGKEGKEEDASITPEMVSRAVCETVPFSGKELLRVLDDVCRAELKAGRAPDELRDALVATWRDYDSHRGELVYHGGA